MITDTSQAGQSQDCRIGVCFKPEPQGGHYLWYRANVAAAREFSEPLRNQRDTLVIIDDQPTQGLRRLPCEPFFMPPQPWR